MIITKVDSLISRVYIASAIQFDRDAPSQCTLGGIVIRVKSRRPRNISLSVAIAGPVTLTRATTNTGALLHSDGMHRVSFYFLKIPMDRMSLPPGVLRTHTHTWAYARMHTPSRKRARSTHNTGEEEKAHARGRRGGWEERGGGSGEQPGRRWRSKRRWGAVERERVDGGGGEDEEVVEGCEKTEGGGGRCRRRRW